MSGTVGAGPRASPGWRAAAFDPAASQRRFGCSPGDADGPDKPRSGGAAGGRSFARAAARCASFRRRPPPSVRFREAPSPSVRRAGRPSAPRRGRVRRSMDRHCATRRRPRHARQSPTRRRAACDVVRRRRRKKRRPCDAAAGSARTLRRRRKGALRWSSPPSRMTKHGVRKASQSMAFSFHATLPLDDAAGPAVAPHRRTGQARLRKRAQRGARAKRRRAVRKAIIRFRRSSDEASLVPSRAWRLRRRRAPSARRRSRSALAVRRSRPATGRAADDTPSPRDRARRARRRSALHAWMCEAMESRAQHPASPGIVRRRARSRGTSARQRTLHTPRDSCRDYRRHHRGRRNEAGAVRHARHAARGCACQRRERASHV